MAKKKRGVFAGLLDGLSDVLLGGIVPKIHDEAEQLMDNVERRALALQERIVQRIGVSLLNGIAVVFLLFALFSYLVEFRGMYRTHAYLVIGAGLLLVALYLKYRMLKDERRR